MSLMSLPHRPYRLNAERRFHPWAEPILKSFHMFAEIRFFAMSFH